MIFEFVAFCDFKLSFSQSPYQWVWFILSVVALKFKADQNDKFAQQNS